MRVKQAGQKLQGRNYIKQEYTCDRQQLACMCLQQTSERTCHFCVVSSYDVIKKTVLGELIVSRLTFKVGIKAEATGAIIDGLRLLYGVRDTEFVTGKLKKRMHAAIRYLIG